MSSPVSIAIKEQGGALVARSLSQIDDRIARIGGTGARTGNALRSTLGRDIGFLTGNLGKLYALAGGLGLAAAVKRGESYIAALSELQVRAKLTTTDLRRLKEEIDATAEATKQTPEGLTQGLLAFTNKGGSLETARKSMAAIGAAAKATGEPSLERMAELAKVLTTELGLAPDKLKDALGLLYEMGRAPGAELQLKGENINALADLMKKGAVRGLSGMKGVQQMGGLYQFAGKLPGGPGESLGFVQMLSKRAQQLRQAGVKVFDKSGEMRSIPDIMLDVLRKIGGRREPLMKAFKGNDVALAFADAYDPKKRTWKSGSDVGKFWGVQGGGKDLDEAAKLRREGAGKPLYQKAAFKKWLDRNVQGVSADVLGFAGDNPLLAGGLLGGGVAGIKYLAPWLAKRVGGKGAGGAGAALGALAGGMPVRVMNWPASFGGSSGLPSGARELAPAALGGAAPGLIASIAAPAIIAMTVGAASAQKQIEIANQKMDEAEAKLSKALEAAGVVAGPARAGAHAFAEGAKDEAAVMLLGPASPIVRALEKLTATRELKEGSFNVTVKAPGLDKPEVQVSRGRKR
jgi:hypothetical protein